MTPEQRKFRDIIGSFSTGMLVTRSARGSLHARPLATVTDPQGAQGGTIHFATSLDSPKVKEIEADPTVLVTLQGKARWAVVHGTAVVVRDRAVIDRFWSEEWRVFFPGGRTDPLLCLLEFTPMAGEYWDDRGIAGVRAAANRDRALAAGRSLETDDAHEHAKVQGAAQPEARERS